MNPKCAGHFGGGGKGGPPDTPAYQGLSNFRNAELEGEAMVFPTGLTMVFAFGSVGKEFDLRSWSFDQSTVQGGPTCSSFVASLTRWSLFELGT